MSDHAERSGTARSSRAVPVAVVLFSGALALTALILGSGAVIGRDSRGVSWTATIAFALLLAAAEYLILRFHYADHIDGQNLFEAALAPALVVLPTHMLLLSVAAAQLITACVRRNRPVKGAFNVAQWSLGAAIGSITFRALADGSTLTLHNTAALLAALTTVVVTNIASFTYVIHLAERQRIRTVLRGFAGLPRMWAIAYLINITLGLLFAAAYQWTPAAMALFLVPLVMLHWASRAYAAVVVDQERLAGMHRASRILAEPVDPRDAIEDFLEEIRRCFSSEVADLVLVDSQTRHLYRACAGAAPVHRTEPAGTTFPSLASLLMERSETTRVTAGTGDPALVAALEQSGFRDCLAAPLINGDRVVGALCTYNRGGMEGFDEGEATILEALAGEAAGAMMKSALLETILEERQKLSEIVGRTSDGIFTLAPGGVIKTWNPALERITGYSTDQIVGSHLFSILHVRDVNGHGVCLESWAEHDGPLPEDLEIRSYSGDSRWLSCSYTRVRDADGRPTMLIVVARDVTEARELEHLKDDFVATVSHELRTPLTPIKGWAVTLLQLGSALDEAQREDGVRTILKHAERLERLITNLLEVSRIERGLAERREAIIDVPAVAERWSPTTLPSRSAATSRCPSRRGAITRAATRCGSNRSCRTCSPTPSSTRRPTNRSTSTSPAMRPRSR